MIQLILVLAFYSAYWVKEVFHDDKLRKLNILASKQDKMAVARLSQGWHSDDWQGHAILAVLTGLLVSTGTEELILWIIITPLYALMIACLRVLILNIGLNLKHPKTKWYYLGSGKIDNLFKKMPIIYYIVVLLVLAISIWLIKIEIWYK